MYKRQTHRSIEQHLVNNKPLDQKKLLSSREEILKPLRVVRESLEQNQNENIASGELLDLEVMNFFKNLIFSFSVKFE